MAALLRLNSPASSRLSSWQADQLQAEPGGSTAASQQQRQLKVDRTAMRVWLVGQLMGKKGQWVRGGGGLEGAVAASP